MPPITTRWRYFLVHQDPELEAWLEEQARAGLHLVRPGLFRFSFTQGEPREEKYRLDFQTLRGAARSEYLDLFRDAGWEFLGRVANRYFFRARPDASSPEIFSDAESRRDRIRRQMRVTGVITALLGFEASVGVSQFLKKLSGEATRISGGAAVLTMILSGAFAAIGIWMLWQMQQAYKRER
jgi:hypothetical protein